MIFIEIKIIFFIQIQYKLSLKPLTIRKSYVTIYNITNQIYWKMSLNEIGRLINAPINSI